MTVDKRLVLGSGDVFALVNGALGRTGLARVGRVVLLAVFLILAATAFTAQIWQLQGNNSYDSDLKADYLRAHALRDGQDIFISIDTLADRYFPTRGTPFRDPSPHPPVVALLFVPATFLPFPVFCALWVVLDVSLLLLVGRWLRLSALAALALAAWPPLFLTMKLLQWELVLLALIMACWRDAESGRDTRAGLWLGLASVIKMYPFLLIVPFLVRRRFRMAGAATGVLALGQVGSLLAVGPSGLWRYYTSVLPHLGTVAYAGTFVDTSVRGTLLRLLPGSGGLVLVLTAAIACAAFVALARLRPEAGPLAVMLLLPTYVLTIYLTLALPLIVGVFREKRFLGLLIPATVLASFPYYTVEHMNMVTLPLPPPLMASVETLGYAGLLLSVVILTWRDRGAGHESGWSSTR